MTSIINIVHLLTHWNETAVTALSLVVTVSRNIALHCSLIHLFEEVTYNFYLEMPLLAGQHLTLVGKRVVNNLH